MYLARFLRIFVLQIMKKILLFCSFLLSVLSFSFAQETERYFYTGLPYGSESMYNPLSLILNGSYDVIQLEGNSRNIRSYPYALAAREVGKNLRDPISPIKNFGVKNFIEQEILPFNPSRKKARGWPNLNLHRLGGGMTYVRMAEWYEFHNVPYPKMFSAVTMAVYHFLNEVVESGHTLGGNVDPIFIFLTLAVYYCSVLMMYKNFSVEHYTLPIGRYSR